MADHPAVWINLDRGGIVSTIMEWNRTKVLVTGGGGFLGRRLVGKLLELGADVAVFCRGEYPDIEAAGARVFRGDIRDESALYEACSNRQVVFNTAAKAGIWGSRKEFISINAGGAANLVECCAKAGVPVLVHTSSPSVVFSKGDIKGGDESLPYPAGYPAAYPESKAEAEKIVSKASSHSFRTVSLRPHLIWGVGDPHILPRLAERAAIGRLRQIGDGENVVDLTHVGNVVEAHLKAAEALSRDDTASGKTYFISDGAPVNLWDWIRTFLSKAGLPPPKGKIPLVAARIAGSLMETAYRTFRIAGEPPLTVFSASQLGTSHYFDITAATRDLGYSPVVDLDSAVDEAAEWIRKTLDEKKSSHE